MDLCAADADCQVFSYDVPTNQCNLLQDCPDFDMGNNDYISGSRFCSSQPPPGTH